VRRLAKRVLHATEAPTVAEGWDAYAADRRRRTDIGDVWNNPRRMGLDVENPADVVPYLDREVFDPFLGTPDVIVEIGPGGGRFTEVLLPRCRTLHAVDTSPLMIEALRERFADDERLVYHVAGGQGLDMLGNESVDAAFSYGVFVHLQHWDIYNYLAEVERVLRPGGKAIIQHSNTFSELGWKRFRAELPRQLNRHKLPKTFILNSPELMSELVHRAGLEPVDMVTNVARRDCIALIRKPA
jgi:SAM-dependent methyltransferase